MADFVAQDLRQGTKDVKSYNLYCHYVAGNGERSRVQLLFKLACIVTVLSSNNMLAIKLWLSKLYVCIHVFLSSIFMQLRALVLYFKSVLHVFICIVIKCFLVIEIRFPCFQVWSARA